MNDSILHRILDRSNHAPVTRDKYRRIIDAWIAFAGDDPRGWTPARGQEFYDAMLVRGVSPRSANVTMASLRYVSEWYARQHGGQDFAVVQTKSAGLQGSGWGRNEEDGEPKKRRALDQLEAISLLKTCDGGPIGRRDWTMIIVGLETGMRRKSLEGCAFDEVNRRGKYPYITVPIKGAGGHVTYRVPLSDTAVEAIEAWREVLKTSSGPMFPAFQRSMSMGKAGLVLIPLDRLSASMIGKIVSARAEEAHIQHVHTHLLRHTFVTWREMAGLNGVQISSITGHKSLPAEWRNMKDYIDMAAIAETVRNTTPAWLKSYVEQTLTR